MNMRKLLYVLTIVSAVLLSAENGWASSSTYYSRAGVSVASGEGTVYVKKGATSVTASSNDNSSTNTTVAYTENASSTTSGFSTNYAILAVPGTDYRFDSWTLNGWATNPNTTVASTYGTVTSTKTSSSSPATGTAAAKFLKISVSSVSPTSATLSPTNAQTSSGGYSGQLTFTTSNDNAQTQFAAPTATATAGNGTWTVSRDWSAGSTAVTYTFKGNGYYGGSSTESGSRTNSATITYATAGGTTSASATVTATYPSLILSAGSTEKVYPENPTTDVSGIVIFPVQYCDGAFDFTAAISGSTGGTWTPGDISVSITDATTGSGIVTIPFTFNAGGSTGEFSATLTLTPQTNTGGSAQSVTLTAEAEAEAVNEVSVTSGGTTTEYATWAEGLAAANALSTTPTLTLLKSVNLGTITATQTVSKSMTIDLNGKTLSATVTTTTPLLTISSSANVTITSSKSGGKIYNTGEINAVVYGITVSSGTLTMAGGTITAENTQQFFYGTSSVGGTATNMANVGARGIQQSAATTVNIIGGTVQGIASRNAFGIREESSHANTTTLNITGGTIYAEAASYAYAVYANGKVIMSNGNISTKINSNTVNGNETYTNYRINTSKSLDSYTVNGYGYGIYMNAYSHASAASCYYGTLIMTGGTVTVNNEKQCLVGTSVQTSNAYGLYFAANAAVAGSGKTAADGTKTQKSAAIGDISGATISVTNASNGAYGILTNGYYNSADDTEGLVNLHDATINVSSYGAAYGVYANAAVGTSSSNYGGCYAGRIKLKNNTVTATTTTTSTAVALIATGSMGTVKTATSSVYAGEYASSAYMYVESGTYTANAATSYAMAAITGPWTTSNPQRGAFKTNFAVDGSLGGNEESMAGMYISGGTFKATTGTSQARTLWNSGAMVITGGTFEATSTTTNAHAIYANRGTVTATGATFTATAGTGTAYCVLGEGMINDYVGWKYAPTFTLTNCDITATTLSGNTTSGVYLSGTTRAISSLNSSYSSVGDGVLGGYAVKSKATITGCTINATAAGTTAYGVYSTNTPVIGYEGNRITDQGELIVKNCNITAKTNGTTTAIGVRAGSSSTIEDNTINVTTTTTTSSGIVFGDGTHTISGNTVTAQGTTTVYGIQTYTDVNSATGYKFEGTATLEDNTVTATTTTGANAYAIYLTDKSVAVTTSGYEGSYVSAGAAIINSGKYTATAATTGGYALVLDATKTLNDVSGSATCTVNGGKFKGSATSSYAETNASAKAGNLVLAGGYYVNTTNLNTYVADGYVVSSLASGDAYTEGYRYTVGSGATGSIVCKVYSGSTLKGSYQTLEEAFDYVNLNTGTTLTIVMTDNYALPAGNYTLPAKATLLVPYQSSQTSAIGTSVTRSNTSPTGRMAFKKLSFASGANLTCFGTIEVSGVQYGGGGANTGIEQTTYGQIHLAEGSTIDMESGSSLQAWGYITGKGIITIKNGATSREFFVLGDYSGGAQMYSMNGNSNKVFPITHYYYQNIECPIYYKAGAIAYGSTAIYASSNMYKIDDVHFVGTGSDYMFVMSTADDEDDQWVKKEYNPATDSITYTLNSGAKLNSLTLSLSGYSFTSSSYVLPICSNMQVVMHSGQTTIVYDTYFAPGAKLIIDKLGTCAISKNVYFYDADDFLNGTDPNHTSDTQYGKLYKINYSPSWSSNPRALTSSDAQMVVHGTVSAAGQLYTTTGGAKITSTIEDGGKIIYSTTASSSTATLYQRTAGGGSGFSGYTYYTAHSCTAAQLLDEDGETFHATAGTTSSQQWVYMEYDSNDGRGEVGQWVKVSNNNDCFMTLNSDTYAHPSDYVKVTANSSGDHAYHDTETSSRYFIYTEASTSSSSCIWWECEPVIESGTTYYVANQDKFDNYGTYYYYDSSAGYWKPKTVTITWSINGSTTNYTVNYGTTPKWLGANPTKSATTTYKYEWKGWTAGSTSGTFYAKDEDLPLATANTTYYAYFEETKYSYTITFANANNGESVSATFEAGDTPVCPITPVKASTESKEYTFTNWSGYSVGATLPSVTGAATYTAVFSESTRKYPITFYNYDGTILQQIDVAYGSTPSYSGSIPTKPADVFYSYSFDTWNPAITSVTGASSYYATYISKANVFTITWVNYDGTVLETDANLTYGATPSYDGATPTKEPTAQYLYTFMGWSPEVVEVTEDATYTATFTPQVRSYAVTFVDEDGTTVISTQTLEYGATPTAPADPQKAATAQYTYTFSGWTPAVTTVTGVATYKATYSQTINKYTVVWKNEDGTVLETDLEVEYGAMPTYDGATPTKASTPTHYYTFKEWTPAVAAVSGDAEYTAVFEEHEVVDVTITAVAEGNKGTITGGGTYQIGQTATLEVTPINCYKFTRWTDGNTDNPRSVTATADATYTAQFELEQFTVSVETEDAAKGTVGVTKQ